MNTSINFNLNNRNNSLTRKVNDLYVALSASNELSNYVDQVVGMLEHCVDFISMVDKQNIQLQDALCNLEGRERQQYIHHLGDLRIGAQGSLVSDISLVNNLCNAVGVPAVVTGLTLSSPEREVVAFAKEVSDAYFTSAISAA